MQIFYGFEQYFRAILTTILIDPRPPRGIGDTLNPKGIGSNRPYKKTHVYDSFQVLFIFFLFSTLQ